jgi:hypothetical protein
MSSFATFTADRNARRAPMLKVRVCPAEDWMLQFQNMPRGTRSIEVEDDVSPEWEAVRRRPLPATLSKDTIRADDSDAAVISGLPVPCTVTIDGTPYEVTDGEMRITSPMPAVYEITIEHWPHLPWTATLTTE